MSETWRKVAACRNQTAMMFDKGRRAEARSLCDACPVKELCLWACLREEDATYRYGMAGGMTAGQRAALASRLPFAVIEAAHEAALAAWRVRHEVSGPAASAGGEWGLAAEAVVTPSPTAAEGSSEPTEKRDPVAEETITAVAAAFGIAPEKLLGPSRTRHVVDARQVAMYVLREGRDLSYPAIGAALGGRDHTTVKHAVEQVRARMAERPALRRGVDRLVAGAGAITDCGLDAGVAEVTDVGALLREVARICGVRSEQLLGRSKTRHVVHARHVAMYVLREARQLSYPAIGEAVGGRDHTTAMHAVERVRCAIRQPGVLRDRVEALMAVATAQVAVAA